MNKLWLRGAPRIDLTILLAAVLADRAIGFVLSALIGTALTPALGNLLGARFFAIHTFTVNGSEFYEALIIRGAAYSILYLGIALAVSRWLRPKNYGSAACPECLSLILSAATRCRYCRSEVRSLVA